LSRRDPAERLREATERRLASPTVGGDARSSGIGSDGRTRTVLPSLRFDPHKRAARCRTAWLQHFCARSDPRPDPIVSQTRKQAQLASATPGGMAVNGPAAQSLTEKPP